MNSKLNPLLPQSNRIVNAIMIIALAFVVCYVFIRAYELSFTHDECVSLKIVDGNLAFKKSANNHWLNTFLMGIFSKVFGISELSLRFPNIIGLLFYSFFSYKILSKIKNPILIWLGLSIIIFNPYVIEFFGLARGYGLSLGFAVAAFYFFLKNTSYSSYEEFMKHFLYASVFGMLATLSSFNCLNMYLGILLIFIIEFFVGIKNKSIVLNKRRIRAILIIAAIHLLLFFFIIQWLLMLKNGNQLYFGGNRNFFDDTLVSVIRETLYGHYLGGNFLTTMLSIILILFGCSIVCLLIKRTYSPLVKINLVLILMSSAIITQHYLFDALYPIQRTAMTFVLLIGLSLTLWLKAIISTVGTYLRVSILSIVALCICFPLTYHFFNNINVSAVHNWRYDANTKFIMQDIKAYHNEKKTCNGTLRIFNTWVFEPSINYYRRLYSMETYLLPANKNKVYDEKADFVYCENTQLEQDNTILYDSAEIVKAFEDSKSTFIKKECN